MFSASLETRPSNASIEAAGDGGYRVLNVCVLCVWRWQAVRKNKVFNRSNIFLFETYLSAHAQSFYLKVKYIFKDLSIYIISLVVIVYSIGLNTNILMLKLIQESHTR